jgi:hypothetical protein
VVDFSSSLGLDSESNSRSREGEIVMSRVVAAARAVILRPVSPCRENAPESERSRSRNIPFDNSISSLNEDSTYRVDV